MALTLPPDGSAAYYGPLTLHWTAGDMFDASMLLPQPFADVLSDDDLAEVSAIIDRSVAAAYPGLYVRRFTEWQPSAQQAVDTVVVQEGGGA